MPVAAENQLIKLPANRYTVREREMLSGTAGVPAEFFAGSSGLSRILLAGEDLPLSTALRQGGLCRLFLPASLACMYIWTWSSHMSG